MPQCSHHTTCLLFVDVLTANAIVFVPLFLLPHFVLPEWYETSLAETAYAGNHAFTFFLNIQVFVVCSMYTHSVASA
jgi:hypothetical protein